MSSKAFCCCCCFRHLFFPSFLVVVTDVGVVVFLFIHFKSPVHPLSLHFSFTSFCRHLKLKSCRFHRMNTFQLTCTEYMYFLYLYGNPHLSAAQQNSYSNKIAKQQKIYDEIKVLLFFPLLSLSLSISLLFSSKV